MTLAASTTSAYARKNTGKRDFVSTEVGSIPSDWTVKALRELCKLINGRGFKPYEWRSSGLPIIRIQNLNGSSEFNYYDGAYDRKLEVPTGQLLFAWSGSRGTSFGPHVWKGPLGLLNYHTWKVQTDTSTVTQLFLLHKLRQLTAEIEGWAHGASALVHVQKWQMEGFKLAIPTSVAEQQAIAEALSDADALIESLEQLIAKKRAIKQGAMQELLTGKRRLPGFEGKWRVLPLDGCCTKVQDGTHFSPKIGGGTYLYITSKNVGRGVLKLESVETVSAEEHQKIFARCDVRRGDLLLTKDGASTGNAALNTLDQPFSLLSSVAFLRFSAQHDARYFLQQILSAEGQIQIFEQMSGNAITRLTLAKIRKLCFRVPSLEEQVAIAAVLSDMDAEIEALDGKLAKARAVKQGMMQELLTGRVRLV